MRAVSPVCLSVLLVALYGCIPRYADFGSAQDSREEQAADAAHPDAGDADALRADGPAADAGVDAAWPDLPPDFPDEPERVVPDPAEVAEPEETTDEEAGEPEETTAAEVVEAAEVSDADADVEAVKDSLDTDDVQTTQCGDAACEDGETACTCPNDCLGTSCATGLPGPCAEGKRVCAGDKPECAPLVEPGALTETCNAVDDDCDGQVDNNLACQPGEEKSQSCGKSGTRISTCSVLCTWGPWGPCSSECDPPCDPTLEACAEVATGGWACTSKMVAITAGAFWMGCNNCPESAVKDESCDGDEHSYHKVYLDGYDIDRTEIRADQYAMCVAAGGCTTPGTGADSTWQKPEAGDHPINYVSWWQVEDFCGWVGKRLCSEAEWEMGARGDCDQNGGDAACEAQSRKYPWGNDPPSCSLAVMDDCPEDSQPVCSLPLAGTVPYGLCDMAGNVWEWVADRHLGDYYCEGPAASGGESCPPCDTWPGSPEAWANPPGPAQGTARVYRGGSFNSFADPLRVSERMYGDPSAFFGTLGGRCCRSAQP